MMVINFTQETFSTQIYFTFAIKWSPYQIQLNLMRLKQHHQPSDAEINEG